MKLIIDVPDDFGVGRCYECFGNPMCPFAARGCWAGAKGAERCPLAGARQAVLLEGTETLAGQPVDFFCALKVKP